MLSMSRLTFCCLSPSAIRGSLDSNLSWFTRSFHFQQLSRETSAVPGYDLIFTAETIYDPGNYAKLASFLEAHLVTDTGRAFFATKR